MEDREDNSALRAQPQTAELPHQASPSATHVLPWRWQHDALVTADGRIVLHVHAESACGRADDDYYSCRPPSPMVTLYCTPEHREFIRRACNAHDDLVGALTEGADQLEAWIEGARSHKDISAADERTQRAVVARMRAALAKAAQTSETRGEADPSNPRP